MFRTLRQSRYLALGALMLVVATICVAAGTWQISRFDQKRHENDALRANAHQGASIVSAVLPLVGRGRPSEDDVEFRQVRATGTYDADGQTLVGDRTVRGQTGFLVLTPLRTVEGPILLVVRGFAAPPNSGRPPTPAAPPIGRVTIEARTASPDSSNDDAAALGQHQVGSINPGEQATRLGGAVYNGYAQLESGQPGVRGLVSIPKPNLSNPAGGAFELQHFAYVIQWYLFALLALAAPFALARSETKRPVIAEFDELEPRVPRRLALARRLSIGSGDSGGGGDLVPVAKTPEEARVAKLTDRYGRVR